ncbi:hypothetical protein [Bradyrhizobium barranii]
MRRKFILALPLLVAIWPGHASSDDSVVCNDEKVASNIRIEVCTRLLDQEKNKESRSRLLARRADAYFDKDDFPHALTDFDEAIAPVGRSKSPGYGHLKLPHLMIAVSAAEQQ